MGFEHRGGIAGLPLLRTLVVFCQKSCETSSWEVMYSCFISVNKFGSFKNLFETIISLSELQFRCRRFILLVQMKEVVSRSYGSNTNSQNPWK